MAATRCSVQWFLHPPAVQVTNRVRFWELQKLEREKLFRPGACSHLNISRDMSFDSDLFLSLPVQNIFILCISIMCKQEMITGCIT